MLFFAAVHLYWAMGGTLGLPGNFRVPDNTPLLIIAIVSIPLCLIGAWVAVALSQPSWTTPSRRTVQRLAVAIAALAFVHALPTVVDWVDLAIGGGRHLTDEERFSVYLYEPFWLLGGVLFAVAAWQHRQHTRSRRTGRVRARNP
jgi:hypothetical protein